MTRRIRKISLAQHDRERGCVIPSEAEESRGNGMLMFCERLREMQGLAQHDRGRVGVIPSEAEESRGNVFISL